VGDVSCCALDNSARRRHGSPAANAGLIEPVRVRFRHPLVRSAAYRAAALETRRHAALADATDPQMTLIGGRGTAHAQPPL
jgi:hypothetical protein